ncbi:MAG: GNAT family N-acetyltransferase [Trichormus sp. ATA11-4-KO1]|jgi:amino-acid N-acetyltransferase|nr:GNAT family N-acetyltransferase [Trichormus sp. ATA11-4-KO1]
MKHNNFILPKSCVICRAKPKDKWLIIFLVFRAWLDPTQLKWQNFWIIKIDNRVIAIGQLRNFYLAQELGSLFVLPAWRKQGLGTFMTQHLINQATQPLYLKCVEHRLVNFYIKQGFIPVKFKDLPSALQYKFRLSQARKKYFKGFVVFMKYQKIDELTQEFTEN